MNSDDEGWLEPDDQMGVWEHQGRPLTVGETRRALHGLSSGVPVEVEYYNGSGEVKRLRPMHIDLRGHEGSPSAVVITVA